VTQQEYIRLTIIKDKNITSNIEAYTYIPHHIRSLDIHPVALLRHYLTTFRPPSNGFLLAAPKTRGIAPARFFEGPYTNLSTAYKAAYLCAFPLHREVDVNRIASHSGRKSMATWLWDAYNNLRLITDIGHWANAKAYAVNLYFHTSRTNILRCIANL
jgi:hypothetical protein